MNLALFYPSAILAAVRRWLLPAARKPDAVEQAEAALLQRPQVNIPLTHRFAPGVYWREVFMPKDTFVIGHRHLTEHFNVILTGKARVMMDGVIHDIVAPCVLKSDPGVRKVLYIVEDMRWATVHPTTETDLERLEELLIVKSDSFVKHQLADMERLRASMAAQPMEVLCPGSQ